MSYNLNLRIKSLESQISDLIQENKALENAIKQERLDHEITQKVLENLHAREDERIKSDFQSNSEYEAYRLWEDKFKSILEIEIEAKHPFLLIDLRRFNELMEVISGEFAY